MVIPDGGSCLFKQVSASVFAAARGDFFNHTQKSSLIDT